MNSLNIKNINKKGGMPIYTIRLKKSAYARINKLNDDFQKKYPPQLTLKKWAVSLKKFYK